MAPTSWTTPQQPFRIADDSYYVGTQELGSYLLTSDEGHVSIDAQMEENADQNGDLGPRHKMRKS